ncbi:MAG: DUF945 family protein, partial [Gammaproteobacteria bacterium]
IARIAMLGEQIDDTRFTMHMNGMDMETFKAISKHQKAEKPEKGKELEALLPSLQALARSARTNNTSIQIDDISLGFHGHRVAISGSLAVAPGIDADFDTLAGIGRKVDAHFTVKVPTALILEISTLMARKQSAASNPSAPVNEAATAQMAQGMRDMVVGKMIGEGYARLEGETLVADLDIKEGTFSVNGKAIELPKGGAKPAAAAPAKAPAKKK